MTKQLNGKDDFEEMYDLELEEDEFEENEDLELEDDDFEEGEDLEAKEDELEESEDLELENDDFEGGEDLELEDEELEESEGLERVDDDFEGDEDLELEDDELEESEDRDLEDNELEESDEPGPEEDDELSEGKWKSKARKSRAKKTQEIKLESPNVGLSISLQSEKELDKQLEVFFATEVKAFNLKGNGGAYLSIVKADTGTSIRLSKAVTKKLNNPTQLAIGFEDSYLIICNASGLDVDAYKGNFKDGQTKIYNTSLVDAVIEKFKLDFTGKTSISFGTGYYKQQGRTVLYVKLA